MKLSIDTTRRIIEINGPEGRRKVALYSPEGFELLSDLWLKVGWDQKHSYTFTWLGRPMIQLPEDVLRLQEVLHAVRPDVIIETGVAHGGSLIFHASLCKAMGRGRVVGIDIEIRPENRRAIETHLLAPLITLVEGSSTDPQVVARVKSLVRPGERAFVILDSNHTAAHVAAELEAYHPLVAPGSYLVATDGIMRDLHDVPRGQREWREDNPVAAVEEFVRRHPEFVLETPAWAFHESPLRRGLTYWPSAWLRRA